MATNRLSIAHGGIALTVRLQVDAYGTPDVGANASQVRCYIQQVPGSSSVYYGWNDAIFDGTVDNNTFSVHSPDSNNSGATKTHGPWTFTIQHNPDGTRTINLKLRCRWPHSGVDKTASGTLTLAPLVAPPGTPADLQLSAEPGDQQLTLTMTVTDPGNGAASSMLVQQEVNGVVQSAMTWQPASSIMMSTAPNRRTRARVQRSNGAGSSDWSAWSNPAFTTPPAPTGVSAARQGTSGVLVSFADGTAFGERQHPIRRGTVSGGSTNWADLVTVPGSSLSYLDASPPGSSVIVYGVSTETLDATGRRSAEVVSNQVVLIGPPDAPSLTVGPVAACDRVFPLGWVHNPVDTTAQTFYQARYTTDSGVSWTTGAKTASAVSRWDVPTGTWAAGAVVGFQVRTWGQATTGGSDGAGGSPWSTTGTVRFQHAPTGSITAPLPGAVLNASSLTVALAMQQLEGARPVQAVIELYAGGVLVGSWATTTIVSTVLPVRLLNQTDYQLRAQIRDSNDLLTEWLVVAFRVEYAEPMPPLLSATYRRANGMVQLSVSFPTPDSTHVPTEWFSLSRTIGDEVEVFVESMPAQTIDITDPTPILNGDGPDGANIYRVTAWSAEFQPGERTSSETVLEYDPGEHEWFFISTGDGFTDFVHWMGSPSRGSDTGLESELAELAGRAKQVAQFGVHTWESVTFGATLAPGIGSSVAEIDRFKKRAKIVCYRDPEPRRLFGTLKATTSGHDGTKAALSGTVTECERD